MCNWDIFMRSTRGIMNANRITAPCEQTAWPATNHCWRSLLMASFLVDAPLVGGSGWHLNRSWTCELQLAVRPSNHGQCCRCCEGVREAVTLQNSREPWTLEMSGLEEWTLEEFDSLRLFLWDLDRFARPSGTVVSLAQEDMIVEECNRYRFKQSVASIITNS